MQTVIIPEIEIWPFSCICRKTADAALSLKVPFLYRRYSIRNPNQRSSFHRNYKYGRFYAYTVTHHPKKSKCAQITKVSTVLYEIGIAENVRDLTFETAGRNLAISYHKSPVKGTLASVFLFVVSKCFTRLNCCWFDCSLDATEEPMCGPQLGRLVNHGRKQLRNAVMMVLDVGCGPTLCLLSTKFIEAGMEVLYDYGVKVRWESKVGRNVSGFTIECKVYCNGLTTNCDKENKCFSTRR